MNVVAVTERNCPKGQEPIAWYLVTNEPIDTIEQVADIVDAYRARWVYLALAALGGHLRNNGPPGWIVLGRAYEKLLVLERGWLAARRRSDQS